MRSTYHSTSVHIDQTTSMSDALITVHADGTADSHVSVYMDGGLLTIASPSADALFVLADKLYQAGAALRDHTVEVPA